MVVERRLGACFVDMEVVKYPADGFGWAQPIVVVGFLADGFALGPILLVSKRYCR